jgi:hypothetical protein
MKYRTVAEYREIVRNMPTPEVEGLADAYNECQSLGVNDVIRCDILNEEMERRILEWEKHQ